MEACSFLLQNSNNLVLGCEYLSLLHSFKDFFCVLSFEFESICQSFLCSSRSSLNMEFCRLRLFAWRPMGCLIGCVSLGNSKSGILYPKTDFAFLYLNSKMD